MRIARYKSGGRGPNVMASVSFVEALGGFSRCLIDRAMCVHGNILVLSDSQNCTLSCSVCFFRFSSCRPHARARVSEKQKRKPPLTGPSEQFFAAPPPNESDPPFGEG